MNWKTLQHKGWHFEANTGGAGGGSGDGGDSGQKSGADDKQVTHTQKELDELFAERGKQGGRAAVADLLKELGFKDRAELDASLVAAKKLADDKKVADEASKTELQKAQDAAAAEKTRAEKAEQAKTELEGRIVETEMHTAVLLAASKAGFVEPEDAWLHVDREAITVKDGKAEGVDKAVEALAKSKPYLVGETTVKPPDINANRRGRGGSTSVEDIARRKKASGSYAGV